MASAAPTPLLAQERYPTSFEVTVGAGLGRDARSSVVMDALFTARAHPLPRGALLFALSGAGQGEYMVSHSSVPAYGSLGLLAGRELGRGLGASVRALAGPAYYESGGTGTLGLQTRVDLATAAPFRLALVTSVRGAVLPRFRHETVWLGALALGLRLQM